MADTSDERERRRPLSRFYDTFIAPNTVVFDVERDIVCDQCVLRDLNVEITMACGVRVVVPMHLLYQLQQQHGEFKIFRLAAHWELLPMVKQALGFGFGSIKTLSAWAGACCACKVSPASWVFPGPWRRSVRRVKRKLRHSRVPTIMAM